MASQSRSAAAPAMSAAEWQTRVELACAYRLVAHYGWDDLIFTHLSARIPGPEEHFLINPLGLLFEEITASSLVKVNQAGEILSDTAYAINPAGFVIHSCIHHARPDVGAVFHTHSVAGVAVASQKQGLLAMSQSAMLLWVDVAYHDYEGLALSEDEKGRLVADLGDKPAMILRNHGLLTTGKDVASCFLAHFLLEKACAIQVAAGGGATPLNPVGDDVPALVNGQAGFAFASAAALAWAGLARKMDRLDPGYRN